MAKYTLEELSDIVNEQMPEYRVVPSIRAARDRMNANGPLSDSVADTDADAASPDLDALRGDEATGAEPIILARAKSVRAYAADAYEDASDAGRKEDTIVAVRPTRAHDSYEGSGVRTKAVVVSDGKIIGRQG